MEQETTRVKEARSRNKARFDRTHRLRPKKIDEGDWVLVYDSRLDNQHRSTRKFTKRWFGPYMVLAELDGTRMTTLVAEKWIKAFKRRNEAEPDPTMVIESDNSDREDE